MKREEKKKMLKTIWESIKGIIFMLIVGIIIGKGVLDENLYRKFMGGAHGLWEWAGLWFIGFLSIMCSYLIWGLFNLLVVGKNIIKEEKG